MRREVLLCLLLAGITLGLYWPATRCDFVHFDDQVYVTENAHVQSGLTLANIEWAFSTPVSSNWHPLTMLSLILDYQLFGLHPWGYHFTNILLHALNTFLVFVVLRRLTHTLWRSVLVAALFGWHPLHVESVAWIAERKDVLSTFFFLLTLLAYAEYGKRGEGRGERGERRTEDGGQRSEGFPLPSSIFYLLSLSCFALGLMSKPMLVTVPFVLLLLDFWPLNRFPHSALRTPHSALRASVLLSRFSQFRPLLLEKLPFFALAAAACAVTLAVQHQGGAVMTTDAFPLGARLGNTLISYCRYLGKILWPVGLAIFYPHPGSWPPEKVLLAGVFLSGVSLFTFRERIRHPWLLMGWLWFLGSLVPVIGLVQVGEQSMADRYTYLPSLGVFVLIVWGACELCGRRAKDRKPKTERGEQRAFTGAGPAFGGWTFPVVAGAAAMLLCCLLTRQQLSYWQNSETLFRHALAVTENNGMALNNLGLAVLNHGQADEAINYFQQALHLKPAAAELHNNLGIALLARGRTEEAVVESQTAIRLKPALALAHLNLGSARFRQGRLDQAVAQLQEGVRLEPDNVTGHVNLGVALLNQHRLDAAIAELLTAIRLKPDTSDARYNLGVAYLKTGQFDEATSQLQEALRLKPDDTDAQRDLARAFELKRRAGAQTPNPGDLNNLAWALATSPDAKIRNGAGAIKLAEQACQQTQYQQTIMVGTLAAAYAEAGRFDDAIATAQKACTLALERGETNLLARNQELLALYRTHQPYREPPSSSANSAGH